MRRMSRQRDMATVAATRVATGDAVSAPERGGSAHPYPRMPRGRAQVRRLALVALIAGALLGLSSIVLMPAPAGATGTAIGGTRVCVHTLSGGEVTCSYTNSEGSYAIDHVPGGEYKVGFEATDYFSQFYKDRPSAERANPVTVTVGHTTSKVNASLVEGGKISGTVTKSDGSALRAGVCAIRLSGESAGCSWADSEGNYTITELASGEYKVRFTAPRGNGFIDHAGYVSQFYKGQPTFKRANPVTVTAAHTTSGINASMTPEATGAISGNVTKSEGRAPAPVDVCVTRLSDENGGCVKTDSAGNYTITELPVGELKVRFRREGFEVRPLYVSQFYKGQPTSEKANPVTVTAAHTTSGINASMVEGGKITGTVTNAAGVAIAGVYVCASAEGEAEDHCFPANSEGKYTIEGLASDAYQVEFTRHPPYASQFYNEQPTRHTANPVSVTAEHTTSDINARLVEGGKITGTVTDSGGRALGGIGVCAQVGEFEFEGCSWTDQEGRYTIEGLVSGEYRVSFGDLASERLPFTRQFYKDQPSFKTANPVSVTIGQTTPEINAVLVSGTISGIVTQAGGGPISGLDVCTSRNEGGPRNHKCVETDSEGKYTLGGFPDGDYRIEFTGELYATQFYKEQASPQDANPVTVTGGQAVMGIDGSMTEGGTITGKVTRAGPGRGRHP
jgi:5-hydroxyisourate hydrolase-like protein (transthyretin family)